MTPSMIFSRCPSIMVLIKSSVIFDIVSFEDGGTSTFDLSWLVLFCSVFLTLENADNFREAVLVIVFILYFSESDFLK